VPLGDPFERLKDDAAGAVAPVAEVAFDCNVNMIVRRTQA
jgi:hypothetical protein